MKTAQLKNNQTELKIDKLIEKMTLDEKIGQLNQLGPSPLGGFEISLNEKKLMLEAGRITKEEFDAEVSEMKWDDREDEIREGKIGSFLSIRNVQKVALKAGETKIVTIEVDKNALGYYNAKMEYVVEPGKFTLWMGHDSSCELKTEFTI